MNKIIEAHPPFIWGYCRCGCGKQLPNMATGRRLMRFILGHSAAKYNTGSKHYSWIETRDNFKRKTKQKSKIDKNQINHEYDYYYTSDKTHPFANYKGLISNSRLVYEHYLKILFDEDIYMP